MYRFLIGRLWQLLVVVFVAITITFSLIHLAPGDPASMLLGKYAQEAERERLREELGLNRPILVQYFDYIGHVLRGDLGTSFRFREPVTHLVLERLPATLLLAGLCFILSVVIGIALGAFAATRVGSFLDTIINSSAVIGYSVPVFWTGIILIMVFSLQLKILPVQGMTDVRESYTGFALWVDIGRHLILPLTAMMVMSTGAYVRLMRNSMLDVLNQDYIWTARAKGLKERVVINRHAIRNASLAVITLMGIRIGYLFTSTLMVEIVFSWPGTGRLMYDAVNARDYPMLLGSFLIIAVMISGANLLADLAYAISDPRIRLD